MAHRTILNLKNLNEFVEYHHFKMDTLESAITIIKPDGYMASIDLEDASYTVAIAEEHQKYLKFLFDGKQPCHILTTWEDPNPLY